jgi:hypothetical protein
MYFKIKNTLKNNHSHIFKQISYIQYTLSIHLKTSHPYRGFVKI